MVRENREGLRLSWGGAEPQRRNESWPARLRARWGRSGIRGGGASVGINVEGYYAHEQIDRQNARGHGWISAGRDTAVHMPLGLGTSI